MTSVVNECTHVTSLPSMTDDPLYLDRAAAAALLGVSPRTLDRWVSHGRVPVGRTPSGRPRFRRDQLIALLDPDAPTRPRADLL